MNFKCSTKYGITFNYPCRLAIINPVLAGKFYSGWLI